MSGAQQAAHSLALLLTLAFHPGPTPGSLARPLPLDPRPTRLETFLELHRCPAPHYVLEYVRVADDYALDYRILPAISFRESTCGEYGVWNNHWGWGSGRRRFASVPQGIHYVARQLAEGVHYKNKTLRRKLHVYNRNPRYAREIDRLMREIEDRR
jgi:hypothetical protein